MAKSSLFREEVDVSNREEQETEAEDEGEERSYASMGIYHSSWY